MEEIFGAGGRRRRGLRRVVRTPLGELHIRPAIARDAEACCGIRERALEEGRWFITELEEAELSPASQARLIQDLGRSDNSVFLVACLGEQIVGSLQILGGELRRTRHLGRLEIAVAPTQRGHGVGAALMGACVDWAVDNPIIRKLSLNVFAHNHRAIALYERFGFQREGLRVGEYRLADGRVWDDLLMAREIRPVSA